jgi:flagellar assembly factor FliW
MSEQQDVTTLTIKTLQFGEITVEPKHVFYFDNGLLGFEDLRRFVLIHEEETAPFKWLISLEEPEIGFPLLSPWHLDIEYDPGNNYDLEKLVFFNIITLEDELGRMTANMKAPIILDVFEQSGQQVILPKDKYLPDYEIPLKNK